MSLILVDGSALVYRSYYAFATRPLTAPTGEVTSVAFGFANALLKLIQDYRPSHLAVVFDLKGPTFRHAMYAAYKGNRKPMPDDLAAQLPRLRELLAAWGVAVLDRDGYEADDIMATLAVRSAGVVDHAWHYTGDKDFMQLLDRRVGMLKPGRRGDDIAPFTAADVEREYCLAPRTLIDVFALSGDKSDNIPGAPGIGDRTALKLIQDFGSLDALYAGLDGSKLTPRLKRLLADHKEQVLLSRRLFTIDSDVPLDLEWDCLRTVLPISPAAVGLLDALGLHRVNSWAGKLHRGAAAPVKVVETAPPATTAPPLSAPPTPAEAAGTPPPAAAPPSAPCEVVPAAGDDPLARRGYALLKFDADLAAWLEGLPPDTPLCVDTETDSLDAAHARLVGISLAARGRPAAYIPVLRREAGPDPAVGVTGSLFALGEEVDALPAVRVRLAPVLADPRRLKVGQNLKYDEWVLGRHGLPLGGPRFDTMLASYVLDPGRRSHGMDELAAVFLGETTIRYDELFARGDRRKDILAVDLIRLAEYAAEDADVTLRLYEVLQPKLAEHEGLARLFQDLEMPLSAVLLGMERSGIKIDRSFLSELGAAFAAELSALERRIHDCAGEPFNVQSSQQLAQILFVKLKLKPLKKTTTGWSTDVTVLTQLCDEHDLPQLVLDYRQVAKLQSTYVETLPNWADPGTDLIHTSYSQAVAATGRLSSNDPNLQNIPIRTELGRQIRRAFVPRAPGHVFLSADYSQIELRLLAHLSGDEALRAAFRDGADVHRRTAALIAGVAEAEVTADQRSRAKAINFGVIYGMGARALARQIKVSQADAKAFIDRYFATYPGVRSFIDETTARARRDGYVETMLGRRRLLPDIQAENPGLRAFQERIAVNTPIQGTAADLIKLAMLRLDRALREAGSRALMLLQVHDELVLEVPDNEVAAVTTLVRDAMERALPLSVPLVVDVHTGRNWAEAHG